MLTLAPVPTLAAPRAELLLTRRGLAAWPQVRQAETELQLLNVQRSAGLHPDELAALVRFRENLSRLPAPFTVRRGKEPDGWFTAGGGTQTPWRLKPGVLDRLLEGLSVQEPAFSLLVRILAVDDGHLRNALENGLRRRLKPEWERQRQAEEARIAAQRSERERQRAAEQLDAEKAAARTKESNVNSASVAPPGTNGRLMSTRERIAQWVATRNIDLTQCVPMHEQRAIARELELSPGSVSGHLSALRKERGIELGEAPPTEPAPAATPPASEPTAATESVTTEASAVAAAAAEPEADCEESGKDEFPEPGQWAVSERLAELVRERDAAQGEVRRLEDELESVNTELERLRSAPPREPIFRFEIPSGPWSPEARERALRLAIEYSPHVLLMAAELGAAAMRGPRR